MVDGEHEPFVRLIALALLGGYLLLQTIACWILMTCFSAIPAEHRKQEPMLVWLLIIPLIALVWNFFVHPRLAESYRSYFDSRPDLDVPGDCGRRLALTYSILFALVIVPCLGILTLTAAVVVLIIFLFKALELRRRVLDSVS